MFNILLYVIIFSVITLSLITPYIGIVSYYLLAILGPQYIWWWIFQEVRVSFIISIPLVIGVALKILTNKSNTINLSNKHNFCLFTIWICTAISYFLGPYVTESRLYGLDSFSMFRQLTICFFIYFISCLEINSLKKLRYLSIIIVISTVYLTYWANFQYISQNWAQFDFGRLTGPASGYGGSIYQDSNVFAVIFSCGLPFLFYFAYEYRQKWIRIIVWSTIPFAMHAIFMTGSRGGLLSLVMVLIVWSLVIKRKTLTFFAIIFVFIFYQWQGGELMHDRSQTIIAHEGEESAENRIVAWKGGLKMAVAYPFTGVGVGGFALALPDFVESVPRVAHNTFIQFIGESGFIAGLAYLLAIYYFFVNSFKIHISCQNRRHQNDLNMVARYNYASVISFTGFITCSIFLSLGSYELFFLLFIFNNTMFNIAVKKINE